MSEQLTDSDLELIEARAKYAAALEHTILGSYIERHDWPSTGDDKIIIHRSTALWLVAALREAWAERDVMQERESAYMEFVAYMAQKSGVKVPGMFQSRLELLQLRYGEQLVDNDANASDEATGGGG